jgi:hypothetical protein
VQLGVSTVLDFDSIRILLPAMLVARAAAGVPPNPHGQQLANVGIIMCALAGVTVIARLCVRIFMQRNTGWDDYTLIASLARASLSTSSTLFSNYLSSWPLG